LLLELAAVVDCVREGDGTEPIRVELVWGEQATAEDLSCGYLTGGLMGKECSDCGGLGLLVLVHKALEAVEDGAA